MHLALASERHDRAGRVGLALALLLLAARVQLAASAEDDWLPTADGGATCQLRIGGGTIEIDCARRDLAVGLPRVRTWVETAARAVTSFYGHYPVPAVTITLDVDEGRAPHHGRTYNGRWIHCALGADTTAPALIDDWIMTHEMFHLGFPNLDQRHLWLQEGLSTYLEPLARARIGALSVDEVWRGMLAGMPNGLPAADDQGLDRTATWGRIYWGGCLFCLLADLRIRDRSHGACSLDDALKAILADGGDGSEHWSIERVLRFGDTAVHGDELGTLYQNQALAVDAVDLPALWRRLGVGLRGGAVVYDDHAPWASLRQALTRAPAGAPGAASHP
jgi:hypothetical protein